MIEEVIGQIKSAEAQAEQIVREAAQQAKELVAKASADSERGAETASAEEKRMLKAAEADAERDAAVLRAGILARAEADAQELSAKTAPKTEAAVRFITEYFMQTE